IFDYRDVRYQLRADDLRPDLLHFEPFFFEFIETSARDVVMIEDAVPIFFCPAPRRAPAKMQHTVRTVGDGLHRPQPHLSRPRRAEQVSLSRRTAELLDDHHSPIEAPHLC